MPRSRTLILLGLAGFLAASCVRLDDLAFEPKPIDLIEPIDRTSRARLAYATRTPQDCYGWMTAQGVAYSPVRDQTDGEFCVVQGALTLGPDTGPAAVRLSPARPMMACPLAAAFTLWRMRSVEPAAREILGAEVRQIDHLGVYACRRIYNEAQGRPSGHARAEAVDVAGFRLANGRRVTVDKDWTGDDAEARFLRRVRDDACRLFGLTLSPDYNAEHANHLHLESGRGRLCS